MSGALSVSPKVLQPSQSSKHAPALSQPSVPWAASRTPAGIGQTPASLTCTSRQLIRYATKWRVCPPAVPTRFRTCRPDQLLATALARWDADTRLHQFPVSQSVPKGCNKGDSMGTDPSLIDYVSVFTRFHQQGASSESDFGTEEHFSPLTSGSLSAEDVASLHSLQHNAKTLREHLGRLQQAAEAEVAKSRSLDEAGEPACSRTLFFAKVPPSASAQEVQALFSQYGAVEEINLFKAWAGARSSKGCGLVVYASRQDALSAIQHLHAVHHWEGGDAPMVVEWMDEGKQRDKKSAREQQQDQAARKQQLAGSPRRSKDRAAAKAAPAMSTGAEAPPAGCAPDAYKLFVGNVPRCCTEEHLLPLFESLGRVVELVVVRDKLTLASKGSAFVWFATREMADNAVGHLEAHPCRLLDPSGLQERPLVVRRAKPTRTAGSSRHGLLLPVHQQPGRAGALAGGLQWGSSLARDADYSVAASEALMRMAGAMSMDIPLQVQPSLTAQIAQRLNLNNTAATSNPLMHLDISSSLGMHSLATSSGSHLQLPSPSLNNLQRQLGPQLGNTQLGSPLHSIGSGDNSDWLGAGTGSSSSSNTSGHQVAAMPLSPSQLSAIGGHVHTMATISGAKLTVGALPGGLLQLVMEGHAEQVQSAQAMVNIVLSSNSSSNGLLLAGFA